MKFSIRLGDDASDLSWPQTMMQMSLHLSDLERGESRRFVYNHRAVLSLRRKRQQRRGSSSDLEPKTKYAIHIRSLSMILECVNLGTTLPINNLDFSFRASSETVFTGPPSRHNKRLLKHPLLIFWRAIVSGFPTK